MSLEMGLDAVRRLDRTDRVTTCARSILALIFPRAFERGLFHFDDQSVAALSLWTLIRWERKVGVAALEIMGVDLELLARDLDRYLTAIAEEHPVGGERQGREVFAKTREPVTFDYGLWLQRLLDRAWDEASALGHNYIGTEHLLLAVTRAANAELRAILDARLMHYESVRETVLEALQP